MVSLIVFLTLTIGLTAVAIIVLSQDASGSISPDFILSVFATGESADKKEEKKKVVPTGTALVVGGSLGVLAWVAFIGAIVSCCMICCRRKDTPETYHQLIPIPPPRRNSKRRRIRQAIRKIIRKKKSAPKRVVMRNFVHV